MTPEAALARVIKEARLAAGLSQEKVADALDCSRGYISHIENGLYNPTVSFVFRLAAIYQVSASDLVGRSEALADEPSAALTKPRDHPRRRDSNKPSPE